MSIWKRSLSFAMALVMVFTMLPVNVLAEELNGTEAPEHTHGYESAVTAEASCTEDGVRTYTCSCGDSYTEGITAPGHSYAGEVTTPATCTQDGVKTYTCSGCADSYTEAIPAGHTPGAAATCTDAQTCTVCGEVLAEATGHVNTTTTNTATCVAAGVVTVTCACGETVSTEDVAATGAHSYTNGACSVCGAADPSETPTETPTEEPTEEETEEPEAELSGETRRIYYYNVENWDEVWAAWSFDENDFDDVAHPGEEMDANTELENVWFVNVPVEADVVLFSDGIEVTETLLEQEHLEGKTVTHEVEVRLEGDKFYNLYQNDAWVNYAQTVKAQEETEPETEAPTEAHTHNHVGAVTKAATCEADGVKTFTCSCGDTYTEVIAATGHSYEGTQTKDPTCTEAGEMTYACVCGDSATENLPALGHKYENGKCTVCGAEDPDYVDPAVAEVQAMIAGLPTEVNSEDEYQALAATLAEIDEIVEDPSFPADAYQNLDWAKIQAAYDALDAYDQEDRQAVELDTNNVIRNHGRTISEADLFSSLKSKTSLGTWDSPYANTSGDMGFAVAGVGTVNGIDTTGNGRTFNPGTYTVTYYTRTNKGTIWSPSYTYSGPNTFTFTYAVYQIVTAGLHTDSAKDAGGTQVGGVTVAATNGEVDYDTTTTLNVTEVPGYTAEVYDANGTKVADMSGTNWTYTTEKVTSDLTYAVKYVPIEYTIEWDTNGDGDYTDETDVKTTHYYGETPSAPAAVTVAGKSPVWPTISPVTANAQYSVTYKDNKIYTVNFVANGNVFNTQEIDVTENPEATIADPGTPDTNNEIPKWVFLNWDKDVIGQKPTGDELTITVTAVLGADTNDNSVRDDNETIHITVTGNGKLTIDDAEFAAGTNTYVYNSKLTSHTITATPTDTDVAGGSVDYVKSGPTITNAAGTTVDAVTTGCYTINVEFGTKVLSTTKTDKAGFNGYYTSAAAEGYDVTTLAANIISALGVQFAVDGTVDTDTKDDVTIKYFPHYTSYGAGYVTGQGYSNADGLQTLNGVRSDTYAAGTGWKFDKFGQRGYNSGNTFTDTTEKVRITHDATGLYIDVNVTLTEGRELATINYTAPTSAFEYDTDEEIVAKVAELATSNSTGTETVTIVPNQTMPGAGETKTLKYTVAVAADVNCLANSKEVEISVTPKAQPAQVVVTITGEGKVTMGSSLSMTQSGTNNLIGGNYVLYAEPTGQYGYIKSLTFAEAGTVATQPAGSFANQAYTTEELELKNDATYNIVVEFDSLAIQKNNPLGTVPMNGAKSAADQKTELEAAIYAALIKRSTDIHNGAKTVTAYDSGAISDWYTLDKYYKNAVGKNFSPTATPTKQVKISWAETAQFPAYEVSDTVSIVESRPTVVATATAYPDGKLPFFYKNELVTKDEEGNITADENLEFLNGAALDLANDDVKFVYTDGTETTATGVSAPSTYVYAVDVTNATDETAFSTGISNFPTTGTHTVAVKMTWDSCEAYVGSSVVVYVPVNLWNDTNTNNVDDDFDTKYTVVFNVNGVESTTENVLVGMATPNAPTNPTRQYYTFAGWENKGTVYGVEGKNALPATVGEDNAVDGVITYTAQWTINNDNNNNNIPDETETYTVKYVFNGGKLGDSMDTERVFENLAWGAATPAFDGEQLTWENYKFSAWSPSVANTVSAPTEGNVITYVAQTAQKGNFTVTFKNGFEGATTDVFVTQTVKEGDAVTAPTTNPVWDADHDFNGWYLTDAEGKLAETAYDFSTPVTSNLTLTAKWFEDFNHDDTDDSEQDHFDVVYNLDGGATTSTQTTFEDVLVNLTTPTIGNPTKDGYVFGGWSPKVAEKVTADATYTATWKADTNKNGVADELETVTVSITNPGFGTVTIDGVTASAGSFVYNRNENAHTIKVALTDKDYTDGGAVYVDSVKVGNAAIDGTTADYTWTGTTGLSNGATVSIDMQSVTVNTAENGTVEINGFYDIDDNFNITTDWAQLLTATKKLDGLKDKVLTAAFGAGQYDANAYTVYMRVGKLSGSGTEDVNVETSEQTEKANMAGRFNVGDTQTFIIEKKASGNAPAVSDTISITAMESRELPTVTFGNLAANPNFKTQADFEAAVKGKITVKSGETTVTNWTANFVEFESNKHFAYTVSVTVEEGETWLAGTLAQTKDYTADLTTYAITWVPNNGEAQYTTNVGHNMTDYAPADPVKADTAEYEYEFIGWFDGYNTYARNELPAVTGPVTYTAQYSETKVEYTITWKNSDGTVLGTTKATFDVTPAYTNTVICPDTSLVNAKHSGWDPEPQAGVGDRTYTATFSSDDIYTLIYMDGADVKNTVKYNATQNQVTTEWKIADKENYIFDAWYADADCTTKFEFGEVLEADTSVYAKWIPDTNNNNVLDADETLTVAISGNGTVTFDDEKIVNEQEVVYDSTKAHKIVATPASTDGSKAQASYVQSVTIGASPVAGTYADYIWSGSISAQKAKTIGANTLTVTFGSHEIADHGNKQMLINGATAETILEYLTEKAVLKAILGRELTDAEMAQYDVRMYVNFTIPGINKHVEGYYDIWDMEAAGGILGSITTDMLEPYIKQAIDIPGTENFKVVYTEGTVEQAENEYTVIPSAQYPVVTEYFDVALSDTRNENTITASKTELTMEFETAEQILDAVKTQITYTATYGEPQFQAMDTVLTDPENDGVQQTLKYKVFVKGDEFYSDASVIVTVYATGIVHPAQVTVNNDTTKGDINITTGEFNAKNNSIVSFKVTPKAGYHVEKVTVNGEEIIGTFKNTVFSGQFNIVNGDYEAPSEYDVVVEYGKRELVLKETPDSVYYNNGKYSLSVFCSAVIEKGATDLTEYTITPETIEGTGEFTQEFTIIWNGTEQYPEIKTTKKVPMTDKSLNSDPAEFKPDDVDTPEKIKAFIEKSADQYLRDNTVIEATEEITIKVNQTLPTSEDLAKLKQGEAIEVELTVTKSDNQSMLVVVPVTAEITRPEIIQKTVAGIGILENEYSDYVDIPTGETVARYEIYTIALKPDANHFIDTLLITWDATKTGNVIDPNNPVMLLDEGGVMNFDYTAFNDNGELTLYLRNGYGLDQGVVHTYNFAASFIDPSIEVQSGTIDYFVGESDEVEKIDELIIEKVNPVTVPENLIRDAEGNIVDGTEVQYLARPAGKYTFSMYVDFMGLGEQEISVDLPDLWLRTDETFNEFVTPELSGERIFEILDKLDIEINLSNPSAMLSGLKLEDLTQFEEFKYLNNAGAHEFGRTKPATETELRSETIRIVNTSERFGIVESGTTTIFLNDKRTKTELRLTGAVPTVTYGSINADAVMAQILDGVYADGVKISEAATFATDITKLGASDELQTIEVVYKDTTKMYQDSYATAQIKVNRATATVTIDDKLFKHPDNLPNISGDNTGLEGIVITGPEADISTIQFIAGLNISNAGMEGAKIEGIEGLVQLMLPKDMQEMLKMISDVTGVDFTDGTEMTLSELRESLTVMKKYIVDYKPELEETIDVLINMLAKIPSEVDMIIKIGGKMPTDAGAYLVGAVTADNNYETAFNVGIVVIAPNGKRAEIDWVYHDDNYIFTNTLLQNGDVSLDAQVVKMYEGDENDWTAAEANIAEVFLGIDVDGTITLTRDQKQLNVGAYAEVAMVVDFGNEMYYSAPIARPIVVVAESLNVEFLDENSNVNNVRLVEFDNTVKNLLEGKLLVTYKQDGNGYQAGDELKEYNVKYLYTGVQTNGMPYAKTTAPVHAGAYAVTAIVTVRNGSMISHAGVGHAVLTIEPTDSDISVGNKVVVHDGNAHGMSDKIVATSQVAGLTPDTTIISAGLSANLDQINGLKDITGNVNVDMPAWLDEVIRKLGILDAGYADGITASTFLSYVDQIDTALTEQGIEIDAFDKIVSIINQLPVNTLLTFHDDIKYTNVGAYLFLGVVTDSDHYPSAGAGILAITPDATKVQLQFKEDWNGNNIFTWATLEKMDLEAKAYNLNGVENAAATAKVVNLYFGFTDNGEFMLASVAHGDSLESRSDFDNGVYTQMALLLDLGNKMYYAEPIARAFVIVPNVATVEFVDENGNVNNERHFVFNNKPQGMNVRVTWNNQEIKNPGKDLQIRYIGVQSNGVLWNSSEAPIHSGAYTVTATYTAHDELDRLITLGVKVGSMVIEPAKSTIDVQSKLHEYNRTPVSTDDLISTGSVVPGVTPDKTVITTSISTDGTFNSNLLNSITSEVNVDFPAWVDNILTQYAPSIYNGMKAAEFADKVMNKLNNVAADAEALADQYDIPADKLINALKTALAEVEEVVAQLPDDVVLTFKEQADVVPTAVGTYLIIGVVTDSDHYPSADVGVLVIYPKVTEAELEWIYKDSNGIFTLPALKNIKLGAEAFVDGAWDESVTAMINYLTVGIDEHGKLIVTALPDSLTSNGAYTEVAYIPTEIGAEMTVAAPIMRSFLVVPQTVDVVVTNTVAKYGEDYEVPVIVTGMDEKQITGDRLKNLKVSYIGANAVAGFYNSTVKPTNSGIYTVVATYIEKEDNEYAYVGMNVGTLTIIPASAAVDVQNGIHKYNRDMFDVMDLITSDPDDAKLAIITSALNLDSDFSEDGILAIGTSVNIDFPARADEVIKQVLPQAYTDGVELNPFFQKLDDISAKLVEVGFDAAAVETLKNYLEQLPTNTMLTFKEQSEINPSAIGVYLITAVVMDPDYVPAVDSGLLVITADVDPATLKWNYRDSNNIITREVIAGMDMAASAYVKDSREPDAALTERISYVVMGAGSNGSVTLTDDPAQIKNLPNGVYTEVAYIYQQIDAEMTVAIPIIRTFAIVEHSVDVDFADIRVAYDGKQHPVEVTLNGNPANDSEYLTITYINLGRGYYSAVAPTEIGSYTVIAKYEKIVNGDRADFGMEIGNVTITPAPSKIEVTGDTVTYDGKEHTATVTVSGGSGNADYILISGGAHVRKDVTDIGVDAFYGNVNINFPEWLDRALADYEFITEGIDTAYLIDFIDSHRNNLVAKGIYHEKIDEAINDLLYVLKQMPKDVSLTFEDTVGYTESGYYYYYGLVLDARHYPSSDTGLLIIEEAEPVITTEPKAVENLVYNGENQALIVAGSAEGGKLVYSLEENGEYTDQIPVGKDAGTYIVYYKIIGDNDHKDSHVKNITVTIAKAEMAAPAIASKVYNGETQTADVAANELYTVTENNGGIAAGKYDVVLTLSDSKNYKWSGSEDAAKTLTFEITKATDNDWTEAPGVEGWTYGETAKNPTGKAKYGEVKVEYRLANGTDVDYATTVPTDAGDYIVRFTVEETDNYNGITALKELTIAKATPVVEAPTGLTATVGQTLADVELPEGFTWADDDATSVGNVGENEFWVICTPEDTKNYESVRIKVTITVTDPHKGLYPITFKESHKTIVPGATVYVDGIAYELDKDLTAYVPMDSGVFVTTYVFHDEGTGDIHNVYPTNMYVWELTFNGNADGNWAEDENYTAKRIEKFDDIMEYIGCSIRVTGKKGIRMKTGIPTGIRNTLINSSVDGWHLMQTGTCVEWADANGKIYNNLTMATNPDLTGYAYKRGVQDPVFARVNGRDQFTNVLVGFNNEQCKHDLVMRPYMILEKNGVQAVLYGAPVQRSIGYIAYQNRLVYNPGHPAYDFIWGIIHAVYGEKYDADMKG